MTAYSCLRLTRRMTDHGRTEALPFRVHTKLGDGFSPLAQRFHASKPLLREPEPA
jgi:hypothetical protein